MTKSELTTQIGYRYRSASRNFISDTEILTELNRQLDWLQGKVDLVSTIVESTISFTGDGSYNLPSDFKRIISLYDRNNRVAYSRVSRSELRMEENAGTTVYTISGSTILIESISSTATLTLTYYSTKDCFTSGGTLQKGLSATDDTPALQARFQDYLVEATAAVLFRKEGKYDDYNIAKNEAKDVFSEILDENPSQEQKIISSFQPYPELY